MKRRGSAPAIAQALLYSGPCMKNSCTCYLGSVRMSCGFSSAKSGPSKLRITVKQASFLPFLGLGGVFGGGIGPNHWALWPKLLGLFGSCRGRCTAFLGGTFYCK